MPAQHPTYAANSDACHAEDTVKPFPPIVIGTTPLWACSAALAQNSNMMGGAWSHGFMGGYGGPWLAVVLLVVLVGFAVWLIKRR